MWILISFIGIILFLIWYSWVNRNDKGIYISLGTIILILVISSATIYKYQKSKHNSYVAIGLNYNQFVEELNINYVGDSKSEQYEDFKGQMDLLFNRIIILDIMSEITPVPSIFSSQDMREVYLKLKEKIFNIHYLIGEEKYHFKQSMIEDLSKHLKEIGLILNLQTSWKGYGRNVIDYEEVQINRIKVLVDGLNNILEDEVAKVLKLQE